MNRLKQLRIEKNLLQSDIAKIIGVSDRAVGFYETGRRDMNTETLSVLANFFNVTIDYLLGISDIRNLDDKAKQDFQFAYHKETEGLSDEDIKEALRIYKEIKKNIAKNEDKKDGSK